uniref:Uncharacterized protein n=1 Tax=Pseudomonas phage RVTF4 TaxID=3236931 RepID=A0AB39CDG2_9VIRU
MSRIVSKDFTVKRASIITLEGPVEKILALVAPGEYVVERDRSRDNVGFEKTGYVIKHSDPIRANNEGALYYADFVPSDNAFLFVQGSTPINFRVVYKVKK